MEVVGVKPDPHFWAGKRVLLTGHTGFKGGWLSLWLARLGADVTGIALVPATSPALFDGAGIATRVRHRVMDIRDTAAIASCVQTVRPQIVFHLAAQPLVRQSYAAPVETFATNVMGTISVLDALRGATDARVVVVATTDKVYRNVERLQPYREADALGGHDPYSASKAASELAIASYRDSFLGEQGVAVASARAGNVVGGGDWSVERLLPDAVRAWQAGHPLDVRRPDAVRPWQHVVEPLSGYMALAAHLWSDPSIAGSFNFGPESGETSTVRAVIEKARCAFAGAEVRYAADHAGPHEAGLLALDVAKARQLLGWRPCWRLDQTIARTVDWYRAHSAGQSMHTLCEADIDAYEEAFG